MSNTLSYDMIISGKSIAAASNKLSYSIQPNHEILKQQQIPIKSLIRNEVIDQNILANFDPNLLEKTNKSPYKKTPFQNKMLNQSSKRLQTAVRN